MSLILNGVKDYPIEVAKGNITGATGIAVVMRNPACSDTEFTDVWGGGGASHDNFIYPTAAESWEVVSDSVNDASAGTGVRTVLVTTLDANYIPQTPIIVTLNGTTPVAISGTHFRPHHLTATSALLALTAGSSEMNEGTITVQVSGGGDKRIIMLPTFGKSEDSQVTVPAGFTLFIRKVIITWGKDQGGEVLNSIKPFGTDTARISSGKLSVYQSPMVFDFQVIAKSSEKTDRVLRAKSTNADAEFTLIQEYELIDNTTF